MTSPLTTIGWSSATKIRILSDIGPSLHLLIALRSSGIDG
ncbi:hypothetical protein ACPOL_6833 (plasmid) [Acidisarcina polymorpha]|uniref:Uncharacterized protein n=1 Tax=Acidisarcina polymorpha TaxID=2211140 RepID=A0A2Z5G9Y4_9BACT|nr:hypothetical protein ACPOL_6833 [Acidisarcina polymorpha]